MTLTDNAQTLSGAVDEYSPEDSDEIEVRLIQNDEMADPTSNDAFTSIAGWADASDVGLMPPKMDISYYYVDSESDVYTTREMLDGDPEWFDAPEEEPAWVEML